MISLKRVVAVLLAVGVASPLVLAQVKPHDFTRKNASFERSEMEMKKSSLIDKRFQTDSKPFEMREYKNTKPASTLIEKSFYIDDKKSTLSIDKQVKGFSKKVENKMFSPEKKTWFDSEKKQKLLDTERDMNKTYRGKIDINKRSTFDTDYLSHIYDEMQERSMQDINKYQFRRSHPTDPGIKTVTAGGETDVESNNSFLDFFSSRKKIKVDEPLVSLKGNPKQKIPKAETPSQPISPTSQGVVQPSSMRSAEKNVEPIKRESKGKVKAVEYLDDSKASKYNFLRVPQGMKPKGKAVIKVEIDE